MTGTTQAAVRETVRVAVGTAVMTGVMLGVCAAVGHWGAPVALGALVGCLTAVGNFFLMAWQVARLVDKADPNDPGAANAIKARTRLTYNFRMVLIVVIEVAAIGLLKFDWITALMPLLFPQIIVRVCQLYDAKKRPAAQAGSDEHGSEGGAQNNG